MISLYERMAEELEEQRGVMLVTVAASAGSAPRKTGSQMVVGADGRLAGTIGGGSLEFHSEQKAREQLAAKASCLHSFNLNAKDTEGLGMMCGGDVDVWFQYVSPESEAWCDIVRLLACPTESRRGGWLIQGLEGQDPCLLSAGKELLAGAMPEDVDALCLSTCVQANGFFSMPLPRKERAIVFGGGHISQALVPILASVDFDPVVFDSRSEFADPALFPCASDVILGDYFAIDDHLEFQPDDFAVVMTHGHSFDYEVQAQLLRYDLAYIGAIGSARKTRTIREQLSEAGFSDEKIAAVHMPIGTKIDAVTPAEIAVSIAGEMISVRAQQRNTAQKG